MLVAERSPLLRPGPTAVVLSGGNADGARLAELAVRPLG
jgi:hypothetical protein